MAFCDRLRARREAQGLTLLQLSQRIGVSEATVQRYESGEIVNPRRDKVTALAQALGVTEAFLMGYDDAPLDDDILLLARDMQQMSPARRRKAIRLVRLMLEDDD